jgi:predicted metal-dependent phosphoesterase TrpH
MTLEAHSGIVGISISTPRVPTTTKVAPSQTKPFIERLVVEGVRVVAVTDHNGMELDRIRQLQELGAEKVTVLPGIELRSDQGGHPIHYICMFPEDCKLDHVWTTLQGRLGLTPEAIRNKGGDDKVYVPLEDFW